MYQSLLLRILVHQEGRHPARSKSKRKPKEKSIPIIDEVARRKRKFFADATTAAKKAKVHFKFPYT